MARRRSQSNIGGRRGEAVKHCVEAAYSLMGRTKTAQEVFVYELHIQVVRHELH